MLIVFPVDFSFPSTMGANSLACINLDDGNKWLNCTFNPVARLLVMKINSTTYAQSNSLQFTVGGLINPLYAEQTEPFTIQNYYLDSNKA